MGSLPSTIDWCEDNYVVMPAVAEFWNAATSLVMLAFAVLGLGVAVWREYEPCARRQFLGLTGVAIGTGWFHGALTYSGQMLDELTMLVVTLNWLHGLLQLLEHRKGLELAGAATVGLAAWTVAFSALHVTFGFVEVFQVHFTLCVACGLVLLAKIHARVLLDAAQRKLIYLYLATLVVGAVCWQVDLNACAQMQALPLNPQLHAWWHVIMGYHCYVGGMALQCAAQAAKAKAQSRPELPVHYWCGVVPHCGRALPA